MKAALPATACSAKCARTSSDTKKRLFWKAEPFASFSGELRATFTVPSSCAGDFRDALADCSLRDDDRWLAVVVGLGVSDRFLDRSQIVAVNGDRIPALGDEIRFGIFALRLCCHRVECDVVGVIDEDEIVELVVTGKRDRFLGRPLLAGSRHH